MNKHRILASLLSLASAILLAGACGGGGGPNNVANLVFAAKGGDGSPVFAQRIAGLGQTAVWDAGNLGIGFTETDLTTIEMRYDGISSLADAAVTMLSPMTSRAIARA